MCPEVEGVRWEEETRSSLPSSLHLHLALSHCCWLATEKQPHHRSFPNVSPEKEAAAGTGNLHLTWKAQGVSLICCVQGAFQTPAGSSVVQMICSSQGGR